MAAADARGSPSSSSPMSRARACRIPSAWMESCRLMWKTSESGSSSFSNGSPASDRATQPARSTIPDHAEAAAEWSWSGWSRPTTALR
eukprot:scaffold28390_cov109-Isochrysis_galbana.AAC.2